MKQFVVARVRCYGSGVAMELNHCVKCVNFKGFLSQAEIWHKYRRFRSDRKYVKCGNLCRNRSAYHALATYEQEMFQCDFCGAKSRWRWEVIDCEREHLEKKQQKDIMERELRIWHTVKDRHDRLSILRKKAVCYRLHTTHNFPTSRIAAALNINESRVRDYIGDIFAHFRLRTRTKKRT